MSMNNVSRWIPIAVVVALAACAPTIITPEELVVNASLDETFSTVSNSINTEPYPDNTSGWVITDSDQAGGFISAELDGTQCGFLGFSCSDYTARVSVALNDRGDGTTAVNISQTQHELARNLSQAIADRLRAIF